MKPEIKAKMFVALVISFMAFGIGTGAGMFTGVPGSSILPDMTNLTQPGEFPMIFNQPKNTTTTTVQTTQPTQNTEQVYNEPRTQKPSTSTGNSSSSNQNNIKPNSTNN